ncbi:MAG: trypsin-like peptidase domain-containing protein [Rubrivivax sp.]|nr:trypsin-like peptidase domain-containing protein [Rubrivivax sp.]
MSTACPVRLVISLTLAAVPRAVAPRGALAADEQAHVDLFRTASPSVVNITSLGVQRDLFSMNVQQVPRGTGTGFVWHEHGHIVTNFHVIQGANGARVTLADQTSCDAELVGAFPDRDLAVLRIEAPKDKLPPIALGCSPSAAATAARCRQATSSPPSTTNRWSTSTTC